MDPPENGSDVSPVTLLRVKYIFSRVCLLYLHWEISVGGKLAGATRKLEAALQLCDFEQVF